jgi:O-methyltransferase involved in polyketide biosynthesis
MESKEPRPLINDPLAETLAGPKAMEAAKTRAQKAPEGSGRKYKIGMMAIRTKWFDDQLEAALGMPSTVNSTTTDYIYRPNLSSLPPPPSSSKPSSPTSSRSLLPRQVVVLGAGMDTRPWRLHLPSSLSWFEVDNADVLETKRTILTEAGAEFGDVFGSPMHRSSSANTLMADKIGRLGHGSARTAIPLRAEMWEGVVADLSVPGWSGALANSGHRPSQPTIWVLEGLLMYLEPVAVNALFKEMASASAPGSLAVFMSVTEDVLSDIKSKGPSSSELMKSWKFGCPRDPEEWLRGVGWKVELTMTRADMASALRLDPNMCTFRADKEWQQARRSLFMVATPVEDGGGG